MSLWRAVRERIRALFARGAEAGELEEELRFHVAMEAERLVRAGVEPAEARRRAQLVFGGHYCAVEAVREARGMVWLHDAWRDVRLGARSLRSHGRFTIIAMLALALGIGATTAVFTLEASAVSGMLRQGMPSGADYDRPRALLRRSTGRNPGSAGILNPSPAREIL